jgi:hypothetical protein
MTQKLQELYKQIQAASRLNYIVHVEVMRYPDGFDGGISGMIQRHSIDSPLPQDTKRLHLRFCPSVSSKKVTQIKKHIESNFGFHCSVCEWSLPVRLDVYLQ